MTTAPPPNSDGAAPIKAGRRERRKQQTRDDLYEAALELFAERRYDEVSVEDICERAEVGRATFFRFYGNKAGLLIEHNRRIVRRDGLAAARVAEGDQIELVHFVGGG